MTEPSAPQITDELRPYLDTIADRLLSRHAAVMILLGRRTLRRHHAVMPHRRKLYKYKFLDLAGSGSYPGK